MKRMHVNLAVNDLDASIAFYNSLFDSEPDVVKTDYAKWMLDDPRVNFAISTRGESPLYDSEAIINKQDAATCCTPAHASAKPGSNCC